MIKKIILIGLFFTVLLTLSGCLYKDELPTKLKTKSSNPYASMVTSPCNYDKYAFVSGRSGMNGTISADVSKSFDYTTITLRFNASASVIELKVNSNYGIKSLKDQIIDYSKSGSYPISMSIIDWGITNLPTVTPYAGKMYVHVQDNGYVKITWCDISLTDKDKKVNTTAKGGIAVKP